MIELNSGDSEQIEYLHPGSATIEEGIVARITGWNKGLVALVVPAFVLATAALFVLLTPVLNAIFALMGLNYAVWNQWVAWATEMDRGLLLAVGLGLAALLVTLLARYRMLRDYSLYVEAGCPQCHENELIRVQRHSRDRLLGYFGFPVRRYSCRNCTWHGLRFAGYRYSKPGTGPEPVETELLFTELVEASDDLAAYGLSAEQVELGLPMDYDLTAANGAAAVIERDVVSGDPGEGLWTPDDRSSEESLEYDRNQESVLVAADESVQATSVELPDESPEEPVDHGESQANLLELATESNHDMMVAPGEKPSNEIAERNESPDFAMEAGAGGDHETVVQIAATHFEETSDFDESREDFSAPEDETYREIVAEDNGAAGKAEAMVAEDSDTVQEVQEEVEAGEAENGSEAASSVIEDEEFKRLCEEVALSKR